MYWIIKCTISFSYGTPYIQPQDTVEIVGTNGLFSRISSSHSVTYNNGKTVKKIESIIPW